MSYTRPHVITVKKIILDVVTGPSISDSGNTGGALEGRMVEVHWPHI